MVTSRAEAFVSRPYRTAGAACACWRGDRI